ncbi:MAG: CoA-transferase [bacterium]|nr:CoA-transferase [bacterium]
MTAPTWTQNELLAVAASRLLRDGTVVFAGVGTALLAAILARTTHAPRLTIVVEGGVIGPEVKAKHLPISTNEMAAGRHAAALSGITDLFLLAQRGFFDYGFLGLAQIDPYGTINTSVLGPGDPPKVRLPGSGGANDIASLCREVLIVTAHERRRFVERVDFVTSPGHLGPGATRREAGLVFGGPSCVITDLALLDFHPQTHRMRVRALQPGATLELVKEHTGFELEQDGDLDELPPPTPTELAALRELT